MQNTCSVSNPCIYGCNNWMCDGKAYIETLMKKRRNRNDDFGHVVYDPLLAADDGLVAAEVWYHWKGSFP